MVCVINHSSWSGVRRAFVAVEAGSGGSRALIVAEGGRVLLSTAAHTRFTLLLPDETPHSRPDTRPQWN